MTPEQKAPTLEGEALEATQYRGGHLQIIASAGSGKTEVVAQRVAALLVEGVPPSSVVAFTFTERAAASLKSRVERRVSERMGTAFLDHLNGMFIGTIHAYCFAMLQQHVPQYANYDVLDEHRLTAFLTREAWRMQMKGLEGTLFKSIRSFATNLQVIESELLEPNQLRDPLASIYEKYLAILREHRFLTYGQMIAHAVRELVDEVVFRAVHGPLRHLIVDEYQDVNAAQESFIKILSADPVHLCVVGDDDQSIYQWRGSDVSNIVDFRRRYRRVKRFRISANRRSRPDIIRVANHFARSIEGRLPKKMEESRRPSGVTEVVIWAADREIDEARAIAETIRRAHDRLGYRYKDIAILCRGRISFPAILNALRDLGVPVQPGGRTGLFLQPDADLFGRTICWLVGFEWRIGMYGWGADEVTLNSLLKRYQHEFGLVGARVSAVRSYLQQWRAKVDDITRPANLIREFYRLLRTLRVHEWKPADDLTVNRLGTLARCSRVIVDYEATRRRARAELEPGDGWRVQDRGRKYYEWFAIYLQNWARGAYEAFEGEDDVDLDAVDLTTVHQAKGLEWPIVFVPSLTSRRFPSSKTGQSHDWHIPPRLFNRTRYEGSDVDERRLFYVAMTRARDFLSLSCHSRITNRVPPSPYLLKAARREELPGPEIIVTLPAPEPTGGEAAILEISFSDLAVYRRCALAYRMRRLLGFEAPLAPEIGYGKAVHHLLRRIAEDVRAGGALPTEEDLAKLFDEEFYMPAATREAYRRMRKLGEKLVRRYVSEHEDDLHRVWQTERPFALHLGDATVTGRADVILDERLPGELHLAIVDYKTSTEDSDGGDEFVPHDFQLQVYTDAGRREGLSVDRAVVHDLREGRPISVPVSENDIAEAEAEVRLLVRGLRERKFIAAPGEHCGRCDVRELCKFREPRAARRRNRNRR